MKLYKKLLSVLLCFLVLFLYIDIPAFADDNVSASKKAVYHNVVVSDWSGVFGEDVRLMNAYFTIEDSSDIPQGSLQDPVYFYTTDNITFQLVTAKDLFASVCNKKLGILFDSEALSAFLSSCFSLISGVATPTGKIKTALYDDDGQFLGYCLNDISGCYYSRTTAGSDIVTVPADFVDTVRNIYGSEQSDLDESVYFIWDTMSFSEFMAQIPSDYQWLTVYQGIISEYPSYIYEGLRWNSAHTQIVFSGSVFCYPSSENDIYICNDFFDSFLNSRHIPINGTYTIDLQKTVIGSGTITISLDYYPSVESVSAFRASYSPSQYSFSAYPDDNITNAGGYETGRGAGLMTNDGRSLTVYKSASALESVLDEEYTPSVFYSDSFNTYSSADDNSIQMTTQQISAGVTNNNTIYNNTAGSYYNYVDNGYVDSSQLTQYVDNSVNYYYDGGSNPDNPDNPDNPEDPDDNGIWDRFLNAIVTFFEKIGEILGAVLAGIVEMINAILEHIAGILEAISPFTEFLQAAFAWIPEPVPTVLAVGITICILAAVIKFIRG